MEILSANKSDAELIQQAFREGLPVRVWMGIFKEWTWWTPSKEVALKKQSETDETVYHTGELYTLMQKPDDMKHDLHKLKKEFKNSEIISHE